MVTCPGLSAERTLGEPWLPNRASHGAAGAGGGHDDDGRGVLAYSVSDVKAELVRRELGVTPPADTLDGGMVVRGFTCPVSDIFGGVARDGPAGRGRSLDGWSRCPSLVMDRSPATHDPAARRSRSSSSR